MRQYTCQARSLASCAGRAFTPMVVASSFYDKTVTANLFPRQLPILSGVPVADSHSPQKKDPDRSEACSPPGYMRSPPSQEQIQIITSAIGKPTPKAPPIINANAESKLSSAWTSRLDIPILHQAPTSTARRP